MADVKIAWGLGADGVMRHISEVEKGKACGCICPSINCSSPLIANQGLKNAHYFSHQVNTGCGGESALHLAAKQILEESASENAILVLPEVRGVYSSTDMAGEVVERTDIELFCFHLVEAKQEVRLSDELITDVMSRSEKDEALAIEIFVTNAKDYLGACKYRSAGIDCIEINLSSGAAPNCPPCWQRLITSTDHRCPERWRHCPKTDKKSPKEMELPEDILTDAIPITFNRVRHQLALE